VWVIVAAVGLLAVRNVADALVPSALYVPVNLGVAAVLAAIAAADGISLTELGLSRRAAPVGLATGTGIAVAVAVVIGIGAAVPLTRPLFEDQRMADVSGAGELTYLALVRIPLGTALFEEFAFRGVLLALVARRTSMVAAVAVSSVLFGLWHIRPTLGAVRSNDLAEDGLVLVAVLVGTVAVTTIAGVLFCGLRLATGSLLAPVVVHGAINSLAAVAAYAVLA
jgi:uncharacterized protein